MNAVNVQTGHLTTGGRTNLKRFDNVAPAN